MALDTYSGLKQAILLWLARPGDPLIEPSLPDIIRLFEAEAARRLQTIGAERQEVLYPFGAQVDLPSDFVRLRTAILDNGIPLEYVPPSGPWPGVSGGQPRHFTIIGGDGNCGNQAIMQLSPLTGDSAPITITYRRGLPPLSDDKPTNWLLAEHPDCYLFGSLVEAEAFIGADERAAAWGQRREMAFNSIEAADQRKRWPGAPLQMHTGMVTP